MEDVFDTLFNDSSKESTGSLSDSIISDVKVII